MPVASESGLSAAIDGRLYVLTGRDNIYVDGVPCIFCGGEQTRWLFRYDPAQDRWVRRKSAPHFHVGGVAGVIDGKLYVAGGCAGGRAVLNLDIYDPATDTWSSGAPLPSGHCRGGGVVLGGQLYVVGGDTGEVVAYNPKTNRWVKKAPFPIPSARCMSAAKATLNGKARIVVQVGFANVLDEGQATFVYTP